MDPIITAIGFGIGGGAVRIGVTILKALQQKQKIQPKGMIFYSIVMIAAGAFSGIVLGYNNVLSFLGGYAGIDLMDGYYKSFSSKKIRFG